MTKQPRILDEAEVRELLREECAKAGGQKAWCDEKGLAPEFVSRVLNERVPFGRKLENILGLRRGWAIDRRNHG